MIRSSIYVPALLNAVLIVAMILLSSCAPTPALVPSASLKDELQQIRLQQREQADQMQELSRQLSLLQQTLGIEEIRTSAIDPVEALVFTSPEEGRLSPRETPRIELGPEVAAYLAAFSRLAGDQPEAAEEEFERFLREFPGHQQAANARFWLAHAQNAQGKTDLATSNLRRIIIDPQAQFKAPAAMMQLAVIYRRQGLHHQADDIVEQLRNSYPDSHEAQQLLRSDTSSR